MQSAKPKYLAIALPGITWLLSAAPIIAQSPAYSGDRPPDAESIDASISADVVMDTQSSVDDVEAKVGWSLGGDFRGLYSSMDEDARDGSSADSNDIIGRLRTEATWTFTPSLRASARLAGSCTDDDCSLDFVMDSAISGTTLERGKITFDELFLHFFQSDRFDVAIGRLQTKLVTRAGVFSKSLDRADSDNAAINWTDGFHGSMRHANGWESHVILQHNSPDGASNVRRGPIDFSSSDARITYVFALENVQPLGPIVQRAFDINYLPSSLLKDGTVSGRVKDYWGIVGRIAAEWPRDSDERRLRIAGEVGYAPETPTEAALDLGSGGDAGGLAWNVAVSLMDFFPGHDLGVNYGRVDPGWLLSPDFTDNEEQTEVRYRWIAGETITLELRARQRRDLERLASAVQKRDRFDVFLRVTWRFSL